MKLKITMTDILRCENFRLGEFVREVDSPNNEQILNLIALANRLQFLRDMLGKTITITSGFRSPEHNQKIGGAAGSLHLSGMAADIQVKDMTPENIFNRLTGIWSGGLGVYDYHVHVDIGARRRWDKRTNRS